MSVLKIYNQYKQIIFYIVFGVLTTVVNILTYILFYNILGCSNLGSNIVAWILSVLFAYITNKLWVFNKQYVSLKESVRELLLFFYYRLLTGVLDIVIMYVTVDLLLCPNIIMKCISNAIVIVLNYIFSKVIIFK